MPFEEARQLIQQKNIKSVSEFKQAHANNVLRSDFPSHPQVIYKLDGWTNWADFFGTNNFREIEYLSFEEARNLVQNENLVNNQEWRDYSKNKRPKNIPGNPSLIYKNKGWLSWGDFLGNNNERNIDFLPFEKAREIIRKESIKTSIQWREYSKNKRPKNIPANPDKQYANEGWKNWRDFLGNEIASNYDKVFLDLNAAKEELKKHKIQSVKSWQKFCQSGNKPNNIPRNPPQYYSNKGWKGWHDFLSITNLEKVLNQKYIDYGTAKIFVNNLNIDTQDLWKHYCKSGKKPENIPFYPNSVYKDFGWKGWGDWLGTGRQATKNRKYWNYEKSKKFVSKLKLKNEIEWRLFTKSNQMPDTIPVAPNSVYKEEWKGMGDWLGTGNIAPHKKQFMSYIEAKKFVSKLKLKSQNDWRAFCKSNNRPDNLPTNPQKTYVNSGWISYGEFLGTGSIAPGKQVYLDFKSAKKLAQKLRLRNRTEWEKYCKAGDKPLNVPSSPNYIYKNKGWNGWADFLGKE
jgi:hypothetical protein